MELREISREEHGMILNLFIMVFSGYVGLEFMNKYEYEKTLCHHIFLACKDCFPMDEKHSDSYDANYIAWEIIYK